MLSIFHIKIISSCFLYVNECFLKQFWNFILNINNNFILFIKYTMYISYTSNVFYNTNNVSHLWIFCLFFITSQLYQASFHFLLFCIFSVYFRCLQRTRKLVFLCVFEIRSVSLSCLLVILFNLVLIFKFISKFFNFFARK